MSIRQPAAYQNGGTTTRAIVDDESDVEEEALVQDYREQVQFDQDGLEDLDRTMSQAGPNTDIWTQLGNAAMPLDFQATLDTKISSYYSYCDLFHYLLNTAGPLEVDPPNVSIRRFCHE